MTDPSALQPPFRAEHVDSSLRPVRLLNAARARKAGSLNNEELIQNRDECIAEIVAFQDELGMPSVTYGEFRRRVWSSGLTDSIEGMKLKEKGILSFHSEDEEYGVPPSPYAESKFSRRQNIVTDDLNYVQSNKPKGMAKVTTASPAVLHFWLGDGNFYPDVYPDRKAYFEDLILIFREEINDLAMVGCDYLQLDDTAFPCNCDENACVAIKKRGEDPDELTESFVKLINNCIAGKPETMSKG